MATLAVCHACRVLPPAVRMLDLSVKSMHQSQVTGVRNLPCCVDVADYALPVLTCDPHCCCNGYPAGSSDYQ